MVECQQSGWAAKFVSRQAYAVSVAHTVNSGQMMKMRTYICTLHFVSAAVCTHTEYIVQYFRALCYFKWLFNDIQANV